MNGSSKEMKRYMFMLLAVALMMPLSWGSAIAQAASAEIPLDRTGWTMSASTTGWGDSAANTIDGKIDTRWSNGSNAPSGFWIQADMGNSQSFHKIVLDNTKNKYDYVGDYEVFVSSDGQSWGKAVASGKGSTPMTTITFEPQNARYMKITGGARASNAWWSIDELNVYTYEGAPKVTIEQQGGIVHDSTYTISGSVQPAADISITVNQVPVGEAQTNVTSFAQEVSLQPGFNQIVVSAVTAEGIKGSSSINVNLVQEQSYEWSNVIQGGGSTGDGLVIHPLDPDIMYFRTDVSGAFKWDPKLKRWHSIMDQLGWQNSTLFNLDAIALDPQDKNVLYVAGGPGVWASGISDVLRSADQGKTWKRMNLNKRFATGDYQEAGEMIAVDPNNSDVVYVGSRVGGLFKTMNATAESPTWVHVPGIPAAPPIGTDGDYKARGVKIVEFAPDSIITDGVTQQLYVGVIAHGIFQSSDGGSTWSPVEGSPKEPYRIVWGKDGVMYVPSSTGLFAYANGVWTDISPVAGTNYASFSVDPHHPKLMLAAPSHMSNNDFFRSMDGGKTWVNLRPKATMTSASKWVKNMPSHITHMLIDPYHPGRAYIGDWSGYWVTEDITAAETNWTHMIDGFEGLVTYTGVSLPQGARLITGQMDSAGMMFNNLTDAPSSLLKFNTSYMNEVSDLDFSESNPDFVALIGGQQHGESGEGAYSMDGGNNFTIFPNFPRRANGTRMGFGNIAVSATNGASGNPTIVAVPTASGPIYSTDLGQTWNASDGPGDVIGDWYQKGKALAADRVNGNKFYLYKTGTFFTSTNGGANWTRVNQGVLPNLSTWELGNVFYVKAAPGIEGEVWASFGSGGLWRSSDSGATFNKVNAFSEVRTFGFGKEAPGRTNPAVYVFGKLDGTFGVFQSIDMGESWTQIGKDMFVMPTDMEGDRQTYGLVYQFTDGRGIFFGAPTDLGLIPPKAVIEQSAGTVREEQFTISGYVSGNAVVTISVTGPDGLPIGAPVQADLTPESDGNGYRFEEQVELALGGNRVKITAVNDAGNGREPIVIAVQYDPNAVIIELDKPDETQYVNKEDYDISGKVNTEGSLVIAVNGEETPIEVGSDMTFSDTLTLVDGTNEIVVSFTDTIGNTAKKTISIIVDKTAPAIEVDPLPTTTRENRIIVTGKVSKPSTLKINGLAVMVHTDLTFRTAVSLQPGDNTIIFLASDEVGNTAEPVEKLIVYTNPADQADGSMMAYRLEQPLTLDGKLDESLWQSLTNRSIHKLLEGNTDNLLNYGLLWDDQYLYVGAVVQDQDIVHGSSPFSSDGVEVYVNMSHSRQGWNDGTDSQLAIRPGDQVVTAWRKHDNVLAKSEVTSDGYTIEMAIPWQTFGAIAKTDLKIGFDIANNDDDTGAGRSGILMWNGTNNNWKETNAYGEVVLKQEMPDLTAPTAPAGLDQIARSADWLALSWGESSDDRSVAFYYVYDGESQIGKICGDCTRQFILVNPEERLYSFSVRAVDEEGNLSEASNVVYATPDVTAPLITIKTPKDGKSYSILSKLTIDFEVSDTATGSGIDESSVTAHLDGIPVKDGQSIPLLLLKPGKHTLTVQATDKAGNKSITTSTFTVTIK